MKICFLASGGGGNLKFFHLASELDILKGVELAVIAERECDSAAYAKRHGLDTKIITYKRDDNKRLLQELDRVGPDIIVTNWHKIIDEETVSAYRGKLINLHYSLLPAFGGSIGVAPIEAAYRQGCQYIGTTCHYVDEGVDSGKIIAQAIVKTDIPIHEAIDEVFRKGCLLLLNTILTLSEKELITRAENSRYDFSPALSFDDTLFGERFWERLSKV